MDEVFVESIEPFLLVWDKKDLIIDIVCHIEIDRLGAESASYDSSEYTDYKWLHTDEICRFIKENKNDDDSQCF